MTEPENQNQPSQPEAPSEPQGSQQAENSENAPMLQQPPAPQAPQLTPQPTRAELEVKSARSLSTVSTIAGPVSFIIGGVALSTVALVCGIIAYLKLKRAVDELSPSMKAYAMALRQTSMVGIAIGAVALVVNIVGIYLMMPVLMEVLQTGDYSAIMGDTAGTAANPGTGAWG